jgi:hypothetical protein
MLNETAKTVAAIPSSEIKLDRQVKRVLACKPILSRILAEVVEECHGMSFEEVEQCIEGDVMIDRVPVEPGLSSLEGLSQEDAEYGEGLVRYDLRTYLMLPGHKEPFLAKILIDVEAQKDENPGYDLPLRGLYYGCRMVSSQLTREFSVQSDDPRKYGNLKKVYSIWICTERAKCNANCIEKYSIQREMLCGTSKDNPRYDLISVILVNLSKDHDCGDTDNELLRFLTDLFNDEMNVREKLNILQNKYHLPLTAEIEKEVSEMCSYTASVLERGLDQGRAEGRTEGRTEGLAEGRAESIERLLRKGKSPEEVHDLLDYPMEEILRVEREVLSAVK